MQSKSITILLILLSSFLFSCRKVMDRDVCSDLSQILHDDTLRIATMCSPVSYYAYKGKIEGYDYELCSDLAKNMGAQLKMQIVSTETEMYKLLSDGEADLIAGECVETKDITKTYFFLPTHGESRIVLVQRAGRHAISRVTGLDGAKIYVHNNSIFQSRLQSLNDEIGGGIQIVTAPDSLTLQDLIQQVSEGDIDYTLAYQNMAELYQIYNKHLDVRMAVGFPQQIGWVMRKNTPELNDAVLNWWKNKDKKEITNLQSAYWHQKNTYIASIANKSVQNYVISPYDTYFKRYAVEIDWDWRLLAALVYHESRFNTATVSYMGAIGLMQMMPNTASHFGLDSIDVYDPEQNIAAGVQYIKYLQRVYRHVEDKDEQIKFILASYNAGPAHVLDAMALAEKYGKNPHVWYNNVEYYLMKKKEPSFYEDEVVKYGFFRGGPTCTYVQKVLETYKKYLKMI